jgi:protein tyrosine/serine phosphatase
VPGAPGEGPRLPAYDLSNWRGRFKAYWDYWWGDHAFLRIGFQNAFWIGDDLVRTNQPWPYQLAWWKKNGVKTIINLRGGFDASFYALEKDTCERLGLTMVDFTVTSREAPKREKIQAAKALFDSIEYPALMHCKSGADRAGIMSVLYRHFRLGEPIEVALQELSFARLHVKAGKTGVLDYVFTRYLAEGPPKGQSFLEWVESDAYDPKQIKADFKTQWWGTFLTEGVIRRE